ncbi:MAG: outer membrane beta-barrel protein [Alphaproteobacteria bacterium]|nr:outer membrane beta-barrel protein [Alphaproteobacteria bacterium]
MRGLIGLGVLGLCAMAGGPAAAQGVPDVPSALALAPPKNVPVRERSQPGYEPKGLRAGSFLALPRYAVRASAIDNLFATEGDTEADQSLEQSLSVDVGSTWSRHELAASASLDHALYLDNDRENRLSASLRTRLRLDVTRDLALTATAAHAARSEARTTAASRLASPREPIAFTESEIGLTVERRMPRFRVILAGSAQRLDYDDARALDGTALEQDDRDRDAYTVSVRTEAALSPDMFLLVQGGFNWRDYRLGAGAGRPDRDSAGYRVLAGTGFAISDLFRGELAAGLFHQSYDDPTLSDESGLALRARLDWFLTQLMTLSFGADRQIAEADLPGAAQRVQWALNARLDYEILRNLLFDAGYRYVEDSFGSIAREDTGHAVSAGLTWTLNRYLQLEGRYAFEQERSSGADAGTDFDLSRASATWRLRF